MKTEIVLSLLQRHVPEQTVSYCFELWREYPFQLKLSRSRHSKLGDYSWEAQSGKHTITINRDLNSFSFLITYIHEVAHLVTGVRYGHKIKPHGEEWKMLFKELLYPVLKDQVFPDSILMPLHNYMLNPKASSCSDGDLLKALDQFDQKPAMTYLSEVAIGETFRFNKKYYIKESVKRTRSICKEINSGRRYYIPELVQIDMVQKSLF